MLPQLAHLEKLPFVKQVKLRQGHEDPSTAELTLRTKAETVRFAVIIAKTHLSQSAARQLVAAQRQNSKRLWMLFAPRVASEVADLIVAAGGNFVDAAGNCHLNVDDRYFAHVLGQNAPVTPATIKGVRAAGYQVLFALLAEEVLSGETIRVIASRAGVSRQPVHSMLRRLEEEGWLVRVQKQLRWNPHKRQAGLERWLEGYATTVRPKLFVGRYQTPDRDVAAREKRITPILQRHSQWAWGGASAEFRWLKHYRSQITTVHLATVSPAFISELRGIPDPEGPLLLLSAPGPLAWKGATPNTVHPLLVWSELKASSDERAHEAAELVLRQFTEFET